MKIRISESQLRTIIKETLNEMGNGQEVKFPPGFIQKKGKQWAFDYMAKKFPDLDPAGFVIIGDTVRSNGKKKPRREAAPAVAKPEGMDDITYITKFAPKYNKRLANGLSKLREHTDESQEKWEPLDVSHLRTGEVAQAFSDRYYISNFGGIALSNPTNTSHCHIFIPYFDKSTRRFQINLRIYDGDTELEHLCPSVSSLVRRVFGDEWAQAIVEREKYELSKGTAVMAGEETDF